MLQLGMKIVENQIIEVRFLVMIISLVYWTFLLDGRPEIHTCTYFFFVDLYDQNNFLKLLQDIYMHAETDEMLHLHKLYKD